MGSLRVGVETWCFVFQRRGSNLLRQGSSPDGRTEHSTNMPVGFALAWVCLGSLGVAFGLALGLRWVGFGLIRDRLGLRFLRSAVALGYTGFGLVLLGVEFGPVCVCFGLASACFGLHSVWIGVAWTWVWLHVGLLRIGFGLI